MILQAVRRAAGWNALSRMGSIRIFRSSYFFFVLVPIAARLIYKIQPEQEIRILGGVFYVTLGLPFSWKVFYFSSLFFVVATTLYFLFCPQIIKEFRNFREFQEEGRGQDTIMRALFSLYERYGWSFFEEKLLVFARRFVQLPNVMPSPPPPITPEELWRADLQRDRLADAFWHVRELADRTSPAARWACLVSYVAGSVLLGVIFVQNFLYVWRLTF